jgi:REP element-mobilizing transposase RayT
VHATLRSEATVLSLRDEALLPSLRQALRASSTATFRVIAFSVQADHLHLVVEADAPPGLARGMQGLAIRLAKAVNRARARRGRVWHERYHARLLRTPREVRTALVYVLNNFRKHVRTAMGLDPYSSARWFGGWRQAMTPPSEPAPIAQPRTWLLRVGWRRYGPIGVDEVPRMARTPPRCADKSAGE